MLVGVKTDHKCPECGENLQYDIEDGVIENSITANIYCINEDCDYYTWVHIDPIAKEICSEYKLKPGPEVAVIAFNPAIEAPMQ